MARPRHVRRGVRNLPLRAEPNYVNHEIKPQPRYGSLSPFPTWHAGVLCDIRRPSSPVVGQRYADGPLAGILRAACEARVWWGI